jgi:hypothetical protein
MRTPLERTRRVNSAAKKWPFDTTENGGVWPCLERCDRAGTPGRCSCGQTLTAAKPNQMRSTWPQPMAFGMSDGLSPHSSRKCRPPRPWDPVRSAGWRHCCDVDVVRTVQECVDSTASSIIGLSSSSSGSRHRALDAPTWPFLSVGIPLMAIHRSRSSSASRPTGAGPCTSVNVSLMVVSDDSLSMHNCNKCIYTTFAHQRV